GADTGAVLRMSLGPLDERECVEELARDLPQQQLRELLVDEVFAVDEDEDEGKEMMHRRLLFARLREGLPVFRTDAQAEAH
ncbi:hypothetical protein ABZ622_30070, partial [Streptomyces sp. NPDC007164]|uniref:hypothetical protein n=1 Tax=Streptomyces sp. NPDC007164 TaxID=3156918 RepID=UPI0033E73CE8